MGMKLHPKCICYIHIFHITFERAFVYGYIVMRK